MQCDTKAACLAVHHTSMGLAVCSCGCLSSLTIGSGCVQLRLALTEILEQPGAVKPERVRFFRGQMQTIITRALTELEIKAVPSRRCFTLIGALPSRLSPAETGQLGRRHQHLSRPP